ncbi:MAG: PilZ domain-containing protein [Deltaproteobacteria bacterium]|nr:PilZ domain-containing protein [Deltaproteobacteria bacterium]
MKKERRRFPRVFMPIPVEINEGRDSWVYSDAINISQGGMRVRRVEDIPANKKAVVRIGDRATLLKMKVCWFHDTAVGYRFLEIMDESSYTKMIEKFI